MRYFGTIEPGGIAPTEPIAQASPLVTFCQNFYLQFFENELGHEITSIGPGSKKDAVAIRHALKRSGASTTTIQLITWFEGFCDTHQDIMAISYSGKPMALKGFIQGTLRTLLIRTIAWAKELGYVGIETNAQAALTALDRAVP